MCGGANDFLQFTCDVKYVMLLNDLDMKTSFHATFVFDIFGPGYVFEKIVIYFEIFYIKIPTSPCRKRGPRAVTCCTFIEVHQPMRNKRFGQVSDFGDPSLNID